MPTETKKTKMTFGSKGNDEGEYTDSFASPRIDDKNRSLSLALNPTTVKFVVVNEEPLIVVPGLGWRTPSSSTVLITISPSAPAISAFLAFSRNVQFPLSETITVFAFEIVGA